MNPPTRTDCCFNTVLVALVCLAAGSNALRAQMVDQNGNGMSDIWEWKYGATGLAPNGDTDGDGMSNLAESIAGTDPFDSNSVPRVTGLTHSPTNFSVSMACQLGKQYQLQSLAVFGYASNWIAETSLVVRAGTLVTLAAPTTNSAKFFRIAISDVDPNGHGLSDWEEYQIGLDPTKASSSGMLDAFGQPMSDYAYATNKLASQNVVTISATDPTANQPDPGQSPINLGVLTVSRGGFPLNSITVSLGLPAPGPGMAVEGLDHAALPRSIALPAGVSSQTITVTPLSDTNLMSPVIATMRLLPGAGYTLGSTTNASVLIYPSATPNGTGLTGLYYTNSSVFYTNVANFNPNNRVLSRTDPGIDFVWVGATTPPISNHNYSVRWLGQVQPEYTEPYYFEATNTDDGMKLWVNDQLIIDHWTNHKSGDVFLASIPLVGGVRYNLKMDYFNNGGSAAAHLYWYSPSQPRQVIPGSRLYPTNTPPGPAEVTSALSAVAFLGQFFTFTNTGANSASYFTATGLPPVLNLNPTNGVISGTPTVAGDFQVSITTSNTIGLGSSLLDLLVIDTGSSVVQEIWTNVPGTAVTNIPVTTAAPLTNVLGGLAGLGDYGGNFGERVRGYFTAPATANYFFWVAGNDSAELWISNDGEPANKVRRAYVIAPGTATNQWSVQPGQQSPWLALVAGQKYYLEILHKAGPGSGDNWALGWRQDPFGTNTSPVDIVPGYLLSPYYQPPPAYLPGTLYSANLLPQAGLVSSGSGSASLRLSADGTQATLRFSYENLTSAFSQAHIHTDAYGLLSQGTIIYDIDEHTPQPDGSYLWDIANERPTGLTVADVDEIIQSGKSYINVHTQNNPGGEINGHFTAVDGSPTFTPPPDPPTFTDDHSNTNAAARFLIQATFGPSAADIASVQSLGYSGWIDNQFSLPTTHHLPVVRANASADPTTPYPSSLTFNTWWQQSVTAPDQLRQRVAFALSEVMVISQNGVLQNNATAMSSYYDLLLDNALGNFRTLLEAVTLSPAMGLYLDMLNNDVGSLVTGLHANENYAREIQQLFSIGLNRMWPDGTLVTDSQGNLVPTYNQAVVMGYASTFTGWSYYQANLANGRAPTKFPASSANYTNPMVLVPTHHELGTKLLLDNIMLPAAQGLQADPTKTNYDGYGLQDFKVSLDTIFNNQNVGPFICRQLIQRLVTSNPSRDYLYRVVQAFNDNGSGVRGDMQAVIKAILLDYEARSPVVSSQVTFGKQREPLLRVTAAARAFPAPPSQAATYAQSGNQSNLLTTASAHRLNNNDVVWLSFTDGSVPSQPTLPSQNYTVTVRSSNTFTINAAGVLAGSYGQTNGTISVNLSSHGLSAGFSIYLVFTTGGASNGVYQVASVADSSHFAVTTADLTTQFGKCLFPVLSGGGYTIVNRTNLTVDATLQHGLQVGDNVFLNFTAAGSPLDGQYQVVLIPDATHFNCLVVPTNSNTTQNGLTSYPLTPPPLVRNGTANILFNTWNMNVTDTGTSFALAQTPLNSPTVFNFFYPDYQFPGLLAAAGLTTPEFQLTSDTTCAWQMNFMQGGILNNSSNTNGLTSFNNHGGAIYVDLGPWMKTNYTANSTSVGSLVDSLNTLLTGGNLSASAKGAIINFVTGTNFSASSSTLVRDRVQATAHLILTSPDFLIQK